VVVSFLEGDPDRPIVLGSVYNADQMPVYELPKHKTVSTTKSRSTMHGGKTNFNELRFEDLKDKEQVFLHAERDKDERVKKESREYVGQNRHTIIKQNHKESIDQSRHTDIKQDHIVHVGGSQKEAIDGSLEVKIAGSHQQLVSQKFAYGAGTEIHLQSGAKVVIEAGAQLTLKGPGGFVDISPIGVVIQGTMVLINSGGAAGAGSGSNPSVPSPDQPDTADDGTKFDKL
jgi:type VI secretion system secreted protein VgrG